MADVTEPDGPDRDSDDFEAQLAALLQVDPTGISGKATKKAEKESEDD